MCEERRNCIYSFCSRKPKYSVLAHACLPSVARCKAELPPSLDKSVKPLDPAPSSYTHAAKLQVSHGSETCNIYCCWWCCFSVQSVKRGYAGPHKSGFLIAWGWGSMLQTSEHITNFWAYYKLLSISQRRQLPSLAGMVLRNHFTWTPGSHTFWSSVVNHFEGN